MWTAPSQLRSLTLSRPARLVLGQSTLPKVVQPTLLSARPLRPSRIPHAKGRRAQRLCAGADRSVPRPVSPPQPPTRPRTSNQQSARPSLLPKALICILRPHLGGRAGPGSGRPCQPGLRPPRPAQPCPPAADRDAPASVPRAPLLQLAQA